jgi:trehalose 6-phosphate phosphatase
VGALRGAGVPGCAVASRSAECPPIEQAADLVVEGPDGTVALLAAIARQLGR